MKKTPTPQEWIEEFQEFMGAEQAQVPKAVSDSILARVHNDLNLSSWLVFAKVSAIHAVMGFITLLFCPQFGLGFTDGMGLMALFMRFGDQACMVGCGAVFMGGSLLTASLVLRNEEIRVIRKTEATQDRTQDPESAKACYHANAGADKNAHRKKRESRDLKNLSFSDHSNFFIPKDKACRK
jgi:hypothetical protein